MPLPIKLRTAFAASTTIHIVGGVAVIAGIAYWSAQNPQPKAPVVEFAVAQMSTQVEEIIAPPSEVAPHTPEPQLTETEADPKFEFEKTIDEPFEFEFEPENPKGLPQLEETHPLKTITPEALPAPFIKAQRKPGACKPPTYPKRAAARGWEGLVIIEVEISATGAVKGARITTSSGHDILDTAALKAIFAWVFTPAHRGKITEAATQVIRIRFEAGKVSA